VGAAFAIDVPPVAATGRQALNTTKAVTAAAAVMTTFINCCLDIDRLHFKAHRASYLARMPRFTCLSLPCHTWRLLQRKPAAICVSKWGYTERRQSLGEMTAI